MTFIYNDSSCIFASVSFDIFISIAIILDYATGKDLGEFKVVSLKA